MISVIDYGVGNWGAVLNMFKRLGIAARVIRTPAEVMEASKIILPGVGAFDAGMQRLHEAGLVEALNRRVIEQGIPCLGICLGMQLLTRSSEEGVRPGLGWIAASTVRFKFGAEEKTLKVPHMGWNYIKVCKASSLLPADVERRRFYFVHSYHLVCDNHDDVLATCDHGYEFTAVIERGHIMGAQFHPEKSHRFGMKFLQAYAAWGESSLTSTAAPLA